MSRTVQNTMNWVAPIIRYLPLADSNNEPALTNANIIQETVMGPPFCWNWNRATKSFSTVSGTQDYAQAVADFGFIEKTTVADVGGNVKEVSIKESLSADSTSGRPEFVSAQADDGAGNITFRFMKVPDAIYSVTITYQKKPVTISSLVTAWSVPDHIAHICDYGFLALALLHLDDPRITLYNQKFIASLLSINRGLTDMDKNIFIGNWLTRTRQEMNEQIRTQQGNQARGL